MVYKNTGLPEDIDCCNRGTDHLPGKIICYPAIYLFPVLIIFLAKALRREVFYIFNTKSIRVI